MSCLHPIKIKNRNGDWIDAPCGKCVACLNQKRFTLTTVTMLEARKHYYSMFITLTYDKEHLPTAKYSFEKVGEKVRFFVRTDVKRMQKYLHSDIIASMDFEDNRHYV